MTDLIKIGEATFSRPGTSTTIKDGVLTTLANNQPAFEGGGVRAWGQVTNLFRNSNNQANQWAGVRSTVSSVVGDLLYGYASVVSSDSTASVAHYVWLYDPVTVTNGTTYTISAYVMLIDLSVTNRLRLGSNLLTPASTTVDIPEAGKWYRVSHTGVANTSGALNMFAWPQIGASQNTTIPSGTEYMRVSCAQVSAANFLSQHIPTSGTAVTSPKENNSFPTALVPELSGSAWSIAATVTPRAMVSGYSGSVIASNPVNGFDIYIDSTGALFFEAGGVTSSIAAGFANNVAKRFVVTKSGNSYTINVAGVSGSFVGGAMSVDSLTYIGSDANGSWQLNGNINDIRFYSKALSPSEIAGILA